jgi:hypothetical protein
MKKQMTRSLLLLLSMLFVLAATSLAGVIKKDGRVFISDRRGERWEITQAVSIGFDPAGFEFGLGRNAFSPLDDNGLQNATEGISGRLRILGVPGETESKAFAVGKLQGHEIANSSIDDQPIAAAY